MLVIKLKSSATAASALNHRVISLVPGLMFLAEDMEVREGWRVFVNTIWKLIMVVHTCGPRTQEPVQEDCHELEAILGYRMSFKGR